MLRLASLQRTAEVFCGRHAADRHRLRQKDEGSHMRRMRSVIPRGKPKTRPTPIASLVIAPAGNGRFTVTECRGGVPHQTQDDSPAAVSVAVERFMAHQQAASAG